MLKCTYFTGLGATPAKTGGDVCKYKYRYCVVVNVFTVDVCSLCLKLLS